MIRVALASLCIGRLPFLSGSVGSVRFFALTIMQVGAARETHGCGGSFYWSQVFSALF